MEPDLVPYSPILHRPIALARRTRGWHSGWCRISSTTNTCPAYVRTRDPWPRSPHPDVLGYASATSAIASAYGGCSR